MPDKFLSGARVGIGLVVTLGVGDCGQDFLRGFHFVVQAHEHYVAVGQGEFGGGTLLCGCHMSSLCGEVASESDVERGAQVSAPDYGISNLFKQ